MSWTKKNLADIVIAILEGNKVTSQKIPSERQIFKVIEGIVPQLIYNDLKQNLQAEIDGRLFTSNILAVSFDNIRQKKYTTLLSTPLISWYGTSMILINPIQGDGTQFIFTSLIDDWMNDGLEVGNVQGLTLFTIENKTIFYKNIPPQYTQVLVRMVQSISNLDENTVIPMPDHLEPFLLEELLKIFGIQQQQINKEEVQS